MNETKETLKEELDKCISTYGTSDKRTLEVSQKLDAYMVIEQRTIIKRC